MKIIKQAATIFLWCSITGSWTPAMAEYKAVTKIPPCQTGPQEGRGCEGVTDPNLLRSQMLQGVDEIDVKACEAITENINELEKYAIPWECGMPISANKYLLSKPQWVEVKGKEKENAVLALYRIKPNYKNLSKDDPLLQEKIHTSLPVYAYPLDVITSVEGDEKLYIMPDPTLKERCMKGYIHNHTTFWFAKNDGSSLGERMYSYRSKEPVVYAGRVYFVDYGPSVENANNFYISRLGIISINREYGLKTMRAVCGIEKITSDKSTNEE